MSSVFQTASRELSFLTDAAGVVTWADERALRLLSLRVGERLDLHAVPGTEGKIAQLVLAAGKAEASGWELALVASGRPATARFTAAPHAGGVAFLGSLIPEDYGAVVEQVSSAMAEIVGLNRESARQKKQLEERNQQMIGLNRELQDSVAAVRAMHAQLEDRADALRRSVDARGRVVRSVSHEVRTPLLAIAELARLLLAEAGDPSAVERVRQLGFIETSAGQLLQLVTDLLDLSRLEAGKVLVRAQPFTAAELFAALRGMLAPLLAAGGGARLIFEEPAEGLSLASDFAKVSQVLRNLIGNALKFAPGGEIRVSAGPAAGGGVLLVVRDTGLGIAPQDHERIFEEFAQIAGALQVNARGTGLGLPISRRLATVLGGTLTVESALGQGATFSLLLPPLDLTGPMPETTPEAVDGPMALLAPAEAQLALPPPSERPADWQLVPAPAVPQPVAAARVTVLHVDDHPARLYLTSRQLRAGGVRVLEAVDGLSALALAIAEQPDVILLDVNLPDLSGLEVCRALKGNPRTAGCAVLMTSAVDVGASSKVLGLHQGADGYLAQPFEPDELLAMVHSLHRMRRAEQEVREQNSMLVEANRHKDEFVATLAHELRNPLAAATMALRVLDLLPADPVRERRARSAVTRQLGTLGRLIDELLDVSRVSRGRIDLRNETVELRALVERTAASACERWMVARGQALLIDVPAVPVEVIGDPLRLEQALSNVLDNASKYSEPGGRISLRLTASAAEGRCTLSVRDEGLGLTPESAARVFMLFFQAEQLPPRTRAGLGIGLALVRSLIELHGGAVSVRSEGLGRGSEFEITLPLVVVPSAVRALAS